MCVATGPWFVQFREELNDYWEYLSNNDYWEELSKEEVLERFDDYMREQYWLEGCESKESVIARICEVAKWSPILTFPANPDKVILLESYYEDGLCSWVAFAVSGCGFEIDFKKHTASRNTAYDFEKAV